MFVKRLLHVLRRPFVTIIQVVVPIFIITFVYIVMHHINTINPPLTLSPGLFSGATVAFGINDKTQTIPTMLADVYKNQLKNYSLELVYVDDGVHDYLVDRARRQRHTYTYGYIVAALFESTGTDEVRCTVFYNYEAYHTAAISLNLVDNVLLKHYVGSGYSIQTTNHIIPYEANALNETHTHIKAQTKITKYLIRGIAKCCPFLLVCCAVNLITERQTSSKHLQIITGVHEATYWLSNFLIDFGTYLIGVAEFYILFAYVNIECFIDGYNLVCSVMMFFMYCWATLPVVYLASLIFSSTGFGVTVIFVYTILTGHLAFTLIGPTQGGTAFFLRLMLPGYCFENGLHTYMTIYWDRKECRHEPGIDQCNRRIANKCCSEACQDLGMCTRPAHNPLSFESDGIGYDLLALAIFGFFFNCLLILIETGVVQGIWHHMASKPRVIQPTDGSCDDDVENERRRIAELTEEELLYGDVVTLKNISKAYRDWCKASRFVVNSLSLGIPRGQCFGLLGMNGAGKTTTFKLLTGELKPTSGTVYVAGHEVIQNKRKVHRTLGYCAQSNAMLKYLTCLETVQMFARIVGIRKRDIDNEVSRIIHLLLMEDCSKKMVGTLSGGNSRKLNVAIAVIGDPSVILLDEPTGGMDPQSRHQTWNRLTQNNVNSRTIILTSQNMEECNVLCTRLAIMVDGAFRCLGTPQHLKTKFSSGYSLRLTAPKEPASTINSVKQFVEESFVNCTLVDEHHDVLAYRLPCESINWSELFLNLENAKSKRIIEDYTISQTTLEEIYIEIARN